MTDEKIIQLYFSRNEAAIAETSRKYSSYCFKIADKILNDREDAEECLNDTWMQAWNTIPPTRPVHFKLFLARLTRNLSFNRYRSKYTLKRGNGEIASVLDELEERLSGQQDVDVVYCKGTAGRNKQICSFLTGKRRECFHPKIFLFGFH